MTGDRILIVDDEASNVRLLERILAQTGYTDVVSATDSRQALPLFREHHSDILLLDLVMPQPDGMAIMRRIRSDSGPNGHAPILVLTVETQREVKLRALAAGATDFLTKPFDTTEVVLRVRNLLEMRRLQVQLYEQNQHLEETVQARTSALHDAYERERHAAERLRVLERMKDSFMMAVSHELRTPLTVLLGATATLERSFDRLPPERARELVSRLASSGRRLERLLSGLLDVDRIRRGMVEPMRRTTELGGLVARVLEDIDIKDHPLEVHVDDVTAEVDPAQVERILENLLVNAVRHTPPATPIRIEVALRENDVYLAVDDEGPGISDELKEVVFERFEQGAVPEHSPGLGLGLSLVAQFARLHGGRAWVEDRPGGGSSFRVRLPMVSGG
jgi:signal transduction histidine kinase